jgi:tetratricopeptide (TPR) repeat protein
MEAGKPPPRLDSQPETADFWVERAHAVLREQFRRAGKGSIERTEQAVGITKGSLSRWRRQRRLDLGMLSRVLEVLGLDPALFWVEVCGTDFDPVAVAKRPTGPPRDPVVRQALRRSAVAEPGSANRLSDAELKELDGLRDSDPKEGVRQVKSALGRAERRQIPRLLAIYGSARRVEARLDKALEALRWALAVAETIGAGRSECADILQRIGVAVAFTGDHALGLLFAREAAHQHRLAANVAGEGRSLVDQGTRYAHLDQLDEAVGAYQAALRCLPEDEVSNRFIACQSLAIVHQRCGSVGEALKCVRRAEEVAPQVGPRLSALLLATKAEIVTARGDHAEAEYCHAAAVEIYLPLSPIDAALASVELVRAQLRSGRVEQVRQTVRAMCTFVGLLEDNQVASEAISELVCMALNGEEITLRVLDQVALEIENARARPGRRARGRA